MGVILILAAIPLALRWVPRNYIYGYRTPYALSSDEAWYRANTICGRVTIIVGLLSLVPDVLVVQFFDRRTASTMSLAILVVAILASFLGTWLILHRGQDRVRLPH